MVKINTREKFTVLTPDASNLSDNLSAELVKAANNVLQSEPRNLIINLKNIDMVNEASVKKLAQLKQDFYDANASFIVCELREEAEKQIKQMSLFDALNITPTESEAWDIVQMEEIERELWDDADKK